MSKNLENQERENVLWTREKFWINKKNLLEEYKNKHIYFGHTPNMDGKISKKTDKIYNIDCGAFFTHSLGCMEVKNKKSKGKKEIYVHC